MSIQLERIRRTFGSTEVLKGIDLTVQAGEIFGFLGPNGAGKSTTIQILCTVLRPSSGMGRVNGYDILREPLAVRQSIGVIFQEPTLDLCMTAEENLTYHGMLYHMNSRHRQSRQGEVLQLVGLEDQRKQLTKTFSGGMKRRLEVARGLLHEPRTLFLDEPTIGLDPQTRRSLWTYLLKLRTQVGLTLFVTTHYLDEAEYCDRLAILDHGQIIALGSPAELKRLIAQDRVQLTTDEPERASALLAAHLQILVERDGHMLLFAGEHGQMLAIKAIQYLTQEGVAVHAVTVQSPSLDDVFIHLTGRKMRDGGIITRQNKKPAEGKGNLFWMPFRAWARR
jgi:ABC-2 type transport system ATP-binding protein